MAKRKKHRSIFFTKLKLFSKRIIARIVFFFTGIVLFKRKNELNQKDIFNILLKIRIGDIILATALSDTSSLFIPGAVTHCALYVGRRRVIHAIKSGVQYASLHHLVTKYDTFVILRLPGKTKGKLRIIHNSIKFAKQQIGKHYGYEDNPKLGKFFCSELVNRAYQEAGHKTQLNNFKAFRPLIGRIERMITLARKALPPEVFILGNFRVVFLSHNLEIRGKKIVLKKV